MRQRAVQAAFVLAVCGVMAAYQRAFVVPTMAAAQAQTLVRDIDRDPGQARWQHAPAPARVNRGSRAVRRVCTAFGNGLLQCAVFSEETQAVRLLGVEYGRLNIATPDENARAAAPRPVTGCAAAPQRRAGACALPAVAVLARPPSKAAIDSSQIWRVEWMEGAH